MEAVRCIALLLGLALVTNIARAGTRAIYCPFMDAVVSEHCCQVERSQRAPVARRSDCCEARTIGAVPDARIPTPGADVAAAPLLATLPVTVRESLGETPRGRFAMNGHSGLSPPRTRHAAQLVVLRI
jgi:hypothetical protein